MAVMRQLDLLRLFSKRKRLRVLPFDLENGAEITQEDHRTTLESETDLDFGCDSDMMLIMPDCVSSSREASINGSPHE